MKKGKLYIVATPIGNLDDITIRAIDTMKSVDFVACEDTRVTRKILNHYKIETPTISYHQHSGESKMLEIRDLLLSGKNIALVTDAGTPGISDPGNKLIEFIVHSSQFSDIVPVPGASAVTAALSVSGFPTDKFVFMGFPPHKKRRKQFFQEIADNKYTTVFYESSHRIKKALQNLAEVLVEERQSASAKASARQVCVCRELTKKFESIYRGSVSEVVGMDITEKGEFVVIVRSQ
ncbi:MAG: 16S rRNA (cytidine(1402)-2'-O)-methyltransferase [Candidatus Magasanikbacteria bacterium]|nr:16S rRNA (cytidine(1402)-2'-O)-methyltransferase [Candidatus Magasanikbacteria bacterium]